MGRTHSAIRILLCSTFAGLVFACSGSSPHVIEPQTDAGGATEGDGSTFSAGSDGGASAADAGGGGSGFDAASDPADGPPTRKTCTNTFGNALSTFHGRMDGYLVAIVPPSVHTCNGDSTHVHLQVLVSNAVYDVAVNVDGLEADLPHAMVDGPWTEGWHTTGDGLDYPTTLGIHSSAFATTSAQSLIAALANVNHISVFATGYGPTGAHLVHRKGNGNDGAIIANPLGSAPHFFVFRFSSDSF